MSKLKFIFPILLLGVLVLSGIVFSSDKFAKAEEETYDTCVSFCGVKRDNASCLRECDINLKSCVMGCPDGLMELIECANVCMYNWITGRCNPRCYEDYDNALKDTPYVGAASKDENFGCRL